MKNHKKIILNLCKFDTFQSETQDYLKQLTSDYEWNEIIELSMQHSVLPIIYTNLEKNYRTVIPDNTFQLIKKIYQQISLNNINKTKELIKIYKILNDNGIDVLSFKGPILASLAYNDLTARHYTDIDIMIDEKNVLKSKEILNNLSYKSQFEIKKSYNTIYLKNWYYKNFISLDASNSLDLHWRSENGYFSFSIDFESFNFQTCELGLYGNKIKTFSPEMTLIHLCQHGCKHGWEKLIWVLDIHNLIIKNKINWDIVFTKSFKFQCFKMLASGLLISNKFFETELPEKIFKKINSDKKLVKHSVERVNFLLKKNSKGNYLLHLTDIDIYYMNTMNNFRDKFYYFVSFFKITPIEWKLGLPTYLYFGYYLYRPYRIVKKRFLNK